MSRDKTLYSLIDTYLNDTLNDTERKDFETELANDPELQEKVEDSRLANMAFRRTKLWEMKSLAEEIDREQKQVRKTKRIVATAVGLSLVIASVLYMMVAEKYATKAKVEPIVTTQRVEAEKKTASNNHTSTVEFRPQNQTKKVSVDKKKVVVVNQVKEEMTATLNSSNENKEIPVSSNVPINAVIHIVEPTKQPSTKKTENVCEQTTIEASVFTEKTCINNQNGKIHVSNFKGGLQPYNIKVLDEAKQAVAANNLARGNYTVVITDSRNCIKVIENVAVKEVDCRKDFELNLGAGELFDLEPVSKSAILTIYDNGGNKYFYKEFAKGEKIQWNGAPLQGEARTGYFQFHISYQDGETRIGSITVSR